MSNNNTVEIPDSLKKEHLEYLDDLRNRGVVNMFGAANYLQAAFKGLKNKDARKILSYWIKTFSDRHKEN